jgi:hypothetical protein
MTANVQLSEAPKEAKPVEFCGSMGFMSSLLSNFLASHILRSPKCVEQIESVHGDIDMSVHVDKETLIIAQRTIDNVICDLKMTLDRLMFDEGIELLRVGLGKTIFTFPYRRVQ